MGISLLRENTMSIKLKTITLVLLTSLLSAVPLSGYCACAVDGGVCGDAPTWDPCCNPDRYECELEDDADYGTCVLIDDEDSEEE